jgi:hypothetical protein
MRKWCGCIFRLRRGTRPVWLWRCDLCPGAARGARVLAEEQSNRTALHCVRPRPYPTQPDCRKVADKRTRASTRCLPLADKCTRVDEPGPQAAYACTRAFGGSFSAATRVFLLKCGGDVSCTAVRRRQLAISSWLQRLGGRSRAVSFCVRSYTDHRASGGKNCDARSAPAIERGNFLRFL